MLVIIKGTSIVLLINTLVSIKNHIGLAAPDHVLFFI